MTEDRSLISSPPKIRPEPILDEEPVLPGYKPLSGLAVASIILGLLSPLSLAHPVLWLLPVGALASGAGAVYRMARRPGGLSGSILAKTGLVLGIVFGSISITSHFVSRWILLRDGKRLAEQFLAEMTAGSEEKLQAAFWRTRH